MASLCFPWTPSKHPTIAALNRVKSSWYRQGRTSFLTNFHSRSIRFRFGEYDGSYISSIPNSAARNRTTSHFW